MCHKIHIAFFVCYLLNWHYKPTWSIDVLVCLHASSTNINCEFGSSQPSNVNLQCASSYVLLGVLAVLLPLVSLPSLGSNAKCQSWTLAFTWRIEALLSMVGCFACQSKRSFLSKQTASDSLNLHNVASIYWCSQYTFIATCFCHLLW